jgi:hypothetical protein
MPEHVGMDLEPNFGFVAGALALPEGDAYPTGALFSKISRELRQVDMFAKAIKHRSLIRLTIRQRMRVLDQCPQK